MKATLEALNQMQAESVIGRYAIGGAVGATFYLEPAATVDLDVFVTLPTQQGGVLITLQPIYDYLKARGATTEDEYIVVGGWPVQFLPPSGGLQEEAVEQAIEASVEGVSTWVMRSEHLVAIALQTGRAKDHNRILQFLEQKAVDRNRLEDVLRRHNLETKWKQFERRYLEGMA